MLQADGAALYQAIVEAPQDDAPRLIYADWLEENGQSERADFIRLAIAYDRNEIPHEARNQVGERLGAAWAANLPNWMRNFPPRQGFLWGSRPRRGFVSRVDFHTPNDFFTHADAVFAATPIDELGVERLQPEYTPRFFASPLLRRLTSLELLYCRIADNGLSDLANCSALTNLRELNLSGNLISNHGLLELARSYFPNLVLLVLSENQIGDAGFSALANSQGFPNLDRVYINGNNHSEQGRKELAEKVRRVIG